jgi:hypothetical protein
MTPEERKKAIEQIESRARVDPVVFNGYVLKDEMTGERIKLADFHVEWITLATTQKRIAIVSPPEHGKTVNLSIGLPLFEMGRNNSIRMVAVHRTAGQATKVMNSIKEYIARDPHYQGVFPHVRRPPTVRDRVSAWQSDRMIIERPTISKDYTLQCVGVGGQVDGARFDLVILDDPLSYENTRTEGQREQLWAWCATTLFNRVVDGGRIVMLNNTWHPQDLTHRVEESESWKVLRYDAIDERGTPLWPVQWPRERLESKRVEIGTAKFNQMFMNKAIDEESGIVMPEMVVYNPLPEFDDESMRTIVSYDPSTGVKDGAHFAGIVMRADLETSRIYIEDYFATKESFLKRSERISAMAKRWQVDTSVYENAGQQRDAISYIRSVDPTAKIKGWKPVGDKMQRLDRITVWMENGLVWFNPKLDPRLKRDDPSQRFDPSTCLITALLTAPFSTCQDLVDAFSQGVEFIAKRVIGKKALTAASQRYMGLEGVQRIKDDIRVPNIGPGGKGTVEIDFDDDEDFEPVMPYEQQLSHLPWQGQLSRDLAELKRTLKEDRAATRHLKRMQKASQKNALQRQHLVNKGKF